MNDQNELDNVTSTENTTFDNNVNNVGYNRADGSKPPKKSKKGFWIILIILIIIGGGVFYYMKDSSSSKKDEKATVVSTTYSLSKEDEGKISEVVTEITSFYEDSKRTKLKQDIDTSKLKPLKKNIDSVSDETLRKEFLRLYNQLETDIKKGSTTDTSSLESSSSSLY